MIKMVNGSQDIKKVTYSIRMTLKNQYQNIPNLIIAVWDSKDTLFRWRESWASMCNLNRDIAEDNSHQFTPPLFS